MIILLGCNTEIGTSDVDDTILYSNDEILTHEMEGVNVSMTYFVDQLLTTNETSEQNGTQVDSVVVEGTVNLTNETDHTIYYTPSFYAIDEDDRRYENVAKSLGITDEKEPIVLKPSEKSEFRIAFMLPQINYDYLTELKVTVPVPFLEPNSESSGDALGDTTTWVLKIKE